MTSQKLSHRNAPRTFLFAFRGAQSLDPYFAKVCQSYKDLSDRIDDLKSHPTDEDELEELRRRRQGLLDTVLLFLHYETCLTPQAGQAEDNAKRRIPNGPAQADGPHRLL